MATTEDAQEYVVECDPIAALNIPHGNPEIIIGHVYAQEFPTHGTKSEYEHEIEDLLNPGNKIKAIGVVCNYKYFPRDPTKPHTFDIWLFEDNISKFKTYYNALKGGSEIKVRIVCYKYSEKDEKWFKHIDMEDVIDYHIVRNAYFSSTKIADVQYPKCFQTIFSANPAKRQKLIMAEMPADKAVIQVGS